MLSLVGRDPAATGRSWATLWASMTARGITPAKWELGFFNLRDLQRLEILGIAIAIVRAAARGGLGLRYRRSSAS
jgi:hypothetical protein